jgi:uncharacterized protein YjbJ (UPF0337 family)
MCSDVIFGGAADGKQVGSLTGNKDLESEGKADRRAGETKEKVGQVKDEAEGLLEKVEDTVGEVIDQAKDSLHHRK